MKVGFLLHHLHARTMAEPAEPAHPPSEGEDLDVLERNSGRRTTTGAIFNPRGPPSAWSADGEAPKPITLTKHHATPTTTPESTTDYYI